MLCYFFFFFSSRRRHTRCSRDWSSDVCSSDLPHVPVDGGGAGRELSQAPAVRCQGRPRHHHQARRPAAQHADAGAPGSGKADRKSTRLNSSHGYISYAVFCLKKKKTKKEENNP